MPGVHNVPADQTGGASAKTVGTVISATTVRPKIKKISVGATGTPADAALTWILQRLTAAGTGTSITPRAVDPSFQGLALATAAKNHTVEPTYTSGAIDWQIGLHQRQSAIVHFADGEEPTAPATASNGYGLTVTASTGTPGVVASILFAE